jgi:dihydroorotate dehydrogenase (fumarate)
MEFAVLRKPGPPPSCFIRCEEQLRQEEVDLNYHLTAGTESFAESLTYFPQASEFHTGPEGYLKHIRKAKAAVKIPVIASLNGSTLDGFIHFRSLG